MPLYVAKCDGCDVRVEYVRRIADRHDTPRCPQCAGSTRKVLTPVRGFADIEPYQSPVDGRVITGRRARRDDFKRHNCRPWEGLEVERRESEKWRKEQEATLDKKLEETIGRTLHQLPNARELIDG